MKNTAAYTNLAGWFEYLNDDCDYENWSQYLILKLKEFPLQEGLDVGCGGGWFTRAFQKAGYQMTGMDVSPEMLDVAQRNALQSGIRSEYVLGDIAAKKPQKRFDFITAINDCFNYIPKDKLKKALKNVASALKVGGVFIFDVSTPRKFEKKIANTVSVDDRDDVTYMSFGKVEQDVATLDVTLFVKGKEGAYTRLDETHTQYIYTEQELLDALAENGFTVLSVEGHMGEERLDSDRWCFVAKRGATK
ncbi:MAG: class I SAM-dependent methyltransferase [Clostridiales bacterium]|nr:class I SAM-dependent methyltransferase [Clostridiales bacterium]